jgi:tryptophan synthase alpha chain
MNRIDRTFQTLRQGNKKAFIAFITAGYPDLKATAELIVALADNGADIIELGIPFSDPMADGPVIQETSFEALQNHVRLPEIMRVVAQARTRTDVPICFMSYYNPLFSYGAQRFAHDAVACGVDGVIVPDLPLDEAAGFSAVNRGHGLHTVLFAAPTTQPDRLKIICSQAAGFIYYVSVAGVTGARRQLPVDIAAHVHRIKRLTDIPVCVGFGVSTPAQVSQIQRVADGVIVGSALMRTIKENLGRKTMVSQTAALTRMLAGRKQ